MKIMPLGLDDHPRELDLGALENTAETAAFALLSANKDCS